MRFLALALLALLCLGATFSGVARISTTVPSPPSDEPFDLTPFETDIAEVFDANGVARPAWPLPPNTTATTTLSGSPTCGDLSTALGAGATHVIVETGVTIGSAGTPCGTISIASDTFLEMQGTATIYGTLTSGPSNRVKWLGGTIIDPGQYSINGDDILIQNVTFDVDGPTGTTVPIQANTTPHTRRAFVYNSFEECNSYCVLFQPATDPGRHTDTIVAGNKVRGGWQTNTPELNNEVAMRLQNTDRSIVVENYFENIDGEKVGLRQYDYIENSLVIANWFENPGNCGEAATVGTRIGDMDNVRWTDNYCFYDGTHTENAFAFYNTAGTTCDVDSIDNVLVTPTTQAYTAQGCGGKINTGTAESLGDPPWNGSVPTCEGGVITCGPQ